MANHLFSPKLFSKLLHGGPKKVVRKKKTIKVSIPFSKVADAKWLPSRRYWVVIGTRAEAAMSYKRKYGRYPNQMYLVENLDQWWMPHLIKKGAGSKNHSS